MPSRLCLIEAQDRCARLDTGTDTDLPQCPPRSVATCPAPDNCSVTEGDIGLSLVALRGRDQGGPERSFFTTYPICARRPARPCCSV